MFITVFGAFTAAGDFIRAGRYLTGSKASMTANLKKFGPEIEIRTLCISSTPAEAVNRAAFFTEEHMLKPVIVVKETICKNGSTVKRAKVSFAK